LSADLKLVVYGIASITLFEFMTPPAKYGKIRAKFDIAQGKLTVYYSGLQPLWHEDAVETLKRDYEIEYARLDSRDGTPYDDLYRESYNKAAMAAIKAKFGVDIVKLCLVKAERDSKTRFRTLKLHCNSAA
jgi:hypothetical protein